MILLFGGTSETPIIAERLAGAGLDILVSMATDVPLDLPDSNKITLRRGTLDLQAMKTFLGEGSFHLVIDALHPYAIKAHETVHQAAGSLDIPVMNFRRPGILSNRKGLHFEPDHESAAKKAFSFGKPVFLTIGSRNLEPYAVACKGLGLKMICRVLDHPDSLIACRNVGIPEENVIAGRGPFSVEDNCMVIDRFGIGVLVTKDSGIVGGVEEKLKAAELRGCEVVAVQRTETSGHKVITGIDELVDECLVVSGLTNKGHESSPAG